MIPTQGRNLFGKGPNKTQADLGRPGNEMIIMLTGHSRESRQFSIHIMSYNILYRDHQFIPPNAPLATNPVRCVVGVVHVLITLSPPQCGRRAPSRRFLSRSGSFQDLSRHGVPLPH
jgi:hypothetical protein